METMAILSGLFSFCIFLLRGGGVFYFVWFLFVFCFCFCLFCFVFLCFCFVFSFVFCFVFLDTWIFVEYHMVFRDVIS